MKFVAMIAALAAFTVASAAEAAVFSLGTGTANWQVKQTAGVSNNGAALNTITPATVLTGGLPSVWIAPPAGSAWVGQRANDGQFQNNGNSDGATEGTYEYTLSWSPGGGGSFNFSFSGDNTISSLTVTQGGNTLFSFSSGGTTDFFSLINTGTVNFGNIGDVLITATIVNIPLSGTTRNPSGFLVAGTATVNDPAAVPIPAAAALLPLGLAFLGAASRRKKSA